MEKLKDKNMKWRKLEPGRTCHVCSGPNGRSQRGDRQRQASKTLAEIRYQQQCKQQKCGRGQSIAQRTEYDSRCSHPRTLARAFSPENYLDRLQQNDQVQKQAVVLDVV